MAAGREMRCRMDRLRRPRMLSPQVLYTHDLEVRCGGRDEWFLANGSLQSAIEAWDLVSLPSNLHMLLSGMHGLLPMITCKARSGRSSWQSTTLSLLPGGSSWRLLRGALRCPKSEGDWGECLVGGGDRQASCFLPEVPGRG